MSLPSPIPVIPARVFIAKDGRGHVIFSKEAVNLLKFHGFPLQGYLYLEVIGGAAVLKKTQSAEIPDMQSEAMSCP